MKNKDLDYLRMVTVVDEVLKTNASVWSGNEVVAGQVAIVHEAHEALDDAQQAGVATSTGITKDKNVVEDQLIAKGIQLAGFGRAYARVKKDNAMEAKMKLKKTVLDDLRDEELEQRMVVLHKDLTAIGAPLVSYGATPERLATLASLIAQFTKLKPAGQVLVTTRKGHNSTVPQLMSSLRAAFRVLDDVIPQWEETDPEFVRDYQNAREVKDTGSRGGGDEDDKKPDA